MLLYFCVNVYPMLTLHKMSTKLLSENRKQNTLEKKKKKGRGTVPRSDPKPQRLMKRLLCALDQAVTL